MRVQEITVQDLFRKTREEWLDDARQTARNLLYLRVYITIEDVLEACPRPKYLHRNITGAVFHNNDFVSFGFTRSKRPVAHGRVIQMWRLKPGVQAQPDDEEDDEQPEKLFEDIA